jgi:hypothetical protein
VDKTCIPIESSKERSRTCLCFSLVLKNIFLQKHLIVNAPDIIWHKSCLTYLIHVWYLWMWLAYVQSGVWGTETHLRMLQSCSQIQFFPSRSILWLPKMFYNTGPLTYFAWKTSDILPSVDDTSLWIGQTTESSYIWIGSIPYLQYSFLHWGIA